MISLNLPRLLLSLKKIDEISSNKIQKVIHYFYFVLGLAPFCSAQFYGDPPDENHPGQFTTTTDLSLLGWSQQKL